MKISLNWLRDYVQTALCAEEVADILSNLGLPLESVEYAADDAIIDVEVTSNRADCLGLIGIARELAAATGLQLKMPEVHLEESKKPVSQFCTVEVADPQLCGRYTARVIEEVKVGPSPDWVRKRLDAIGMRSVNNIVDATNYAMLETGQPPHAFDYAKISGGRIIVRKACASERMVSIDGSQCDLADDMLIIADSSGPIAVAGVMGGLNTEVAESTNTILLEDAHFEPVSVRRTARRLGLASEASFRFERTVDIEMVDWASRRTAQLIIQWAGGKAAKGVIDIYPQKPQQKSVSLRTSRLNKLLGIEVPADVAAKILAALGFKPQMKGEMIICSIPSWRLSDVYREADLIEEVARVYGYGRIPTRRTIEIEAVPVDVRQKMIVSVGDYLNGCGFYEAITVGFVDDSVAGLFGRTPSAEHLSVKENDSRKSANLLRQSLIGSLLEVVKTNLNVGNTPCRIFEIADVFIPADKEHSGLPDEKTMLSLACDGDFRDLKGAVEGLVRNIDRNAELAFKPVELPWARAAAGIMLGGVALGTLGIVSRAVSEKFDFRKEPVCAAELDFEQLLSLHKNSVIKAEPIPKYPAIERNLSVIVDENISWSDIVAAVRQQAPSELEDVRFVAVYRGETVASGRKSVTLSLRFRDPDGTLTHDAVDRFEADIVAGLAQSVRAERRSA